MWIAPFGHLKMKSKNSNLITLTKHIFFPADFNLPSPELRGYQRLFSHLDQKSFCAFFLNDFMGTEASRSLWQGDKYTLQEAIQASAKSLTIDISFFNPDTRIPKALVHQSRFSDLLVISPLDAEAMQKLPGAFPDKFFEQSGCSVLLCPELEMGFEEVLVLFDYDLSCVNALKSFLNVFGRMASHKRITLLTVTPGEGTEIALEKYFVNFLQRTFSNVGITPIRRAGLMDLVFAQVKQAKRPPVLITGRHGLSILYNQSFKEQMLALDMSLFFSN
jgi:hypothetical protein